MAIGEDNRTVFVDPQHDAMDGCHPNTQRIRSEEQAWMKEWRRTCLCATEQPGVAPTAVVRQE